MHTLTHSIERMKFLTAPSTKETTKINYSMIYLDWIGLDVYYAVERPCCAKWISQIRTIACRESERANREEEKKTVHKGQWPWFDEVRRRLSNVCVCNNTSNTPTTINLITVCVVLHTVCCYARTRQKMPFKLFFYSSFVLRLSRLLFNSKCVSS